MKTSHKLPPSAGNLYVNLVAALSIFVVLGVCQANRFAGTNATLICMGVYALTLLVLEVAVLRTPFKEETGLDFSRFDADFSRILYKFVGLIASYLSIACLYWLFPEYHFDFPPDGLSNSFYKPYSYALIQVLPVMMLLSVPYFIVMDGLMKQPEDKFYALGRALLRRESTLSRSQLWQHFIGWVVKGYFLALLTVYADRAFNGMLATNFNIILDSTENLYHFVYDSVLTIGLVVAVVGHSMTLRLINTHIRSVEPTLFGWWICVMCFQPFKSIYDLYVLPRGQEDMWLEVFHQYPIFQGMWAAVIIVLLGIAILSDIQFGARYSYLTHRGIITSGLYRFTKHPSYVSIWLVYILTFFPFFTFDTFLGILQSSAALFLVGLVYYLRARTEERHLSHDPVYVEYALAMNERSVFRGLTKWLPVLRYKKPEKLATPLLAPEYKGFV